MHRLLAIILLFVVTVSSGTIKHGTSVITLSTMDTIVMAADGHSFMESPTDDPKLPYKTKTVQGESKVAICGRVFLCATAGINPIDYDRHGISVHYHFQQWISTIAAGEHTSVSDYANAIQKKARETFHDIDCVLKQDDFWNSESGQMGAFVVFRVAGFTAEGPYLCDIALNIDKEKRRLVYDDPTCAVRKTTTVHYSSLWGTHHTNSDAVFSDGTPQAKKANELQPGALATAKTLLPDSPPSLQEIVASAATLIGVESEFNPEKVGGIPSVGILVKGQSPKVLLFAW